MSPKVKGFGRRPSGPHNDAVVTHTRVTGLFAISGWPALTVRYGGTAIVIGDAATTGLALRATSRDPKKPLRRHPAVDRRTASAASCVDRVGRSDVMRSSKPTGEMRS